MTLHLYHVNMKGAEEKYIKKNDNEVNKKVLKKDITRCYAYKYSIHGLGIVVACIVKKVNGNYYPFYTKQ